MRVGTWQGCARAGAGLLGNLCGPAAAPAPSRSIACVRLSGYEVCRALREKHPIGELPVLFLTAKT